MRFLLAVFVLVIGLDASARPIGPGGSVPYEQVRNGTMLFPAAVCPEVNQKYSELVAKLDTLRESIRKDANCQDEKAKSDTFAGLAQGGKAAFDQLIAVGQKRELTQAETDQLTSYVEKVTKAGAALTDAVLGSSCFKDDKKNDLSVEVIASLISESTLALATVTGPYGPLIGLGGKMTATLLVSIDKIVRNRRAYDFSDPNQRRAFLTTMCAYHAFRPELDEISRTDEVTADWLAYQKALKKKLSAMLQACPDCQSIFEKYETDYKAGVESVRKPMSELLVQYKDSVAAADLKYVQPLGSLTVIDMRSLLYIEDGLKRIDSTISDLGDVERDHVVQMQNTIEDFLFVKWLPQFVRAYQSELRTRNWELQSALYKKLNQLGERGYGPETGEMIGRLYDPQSLDFGQFANARDADYYRKNARSEINRRLGDLISSLMVIEKTCQFARASHSRYDDQLYQVCDRESRELMRSTYKTLWYLYGTTHKDSPMVKAVFEVPSPGLESWADENKVKLPSGGYVWTSNWMQSLVLLMDQLQVYDSKIYELKK